MRKKLSAGQHIMDESTRKEEISISYLHAICASKGIALQEQRRDEDGIDVTLRKTIERVDGIEFIAQINVQLKSSSSSSVCKEHESHYAYRLEVKNYNDLRTQATAKQYLFVLVLPRLENDWVTHSIESVIIKKCMFWLDLEGKPDTKNRSTVTVHIPKTNILTKKKLEEIFHEVAENG